MTRQTPARLVMALGAMAAARGAEGATMVQPAPDPAQPALTCLVEAQEGATGVTLSGRIAGPAAAAGRYRLEVRKIGSGGSSKIAQGGEFRIEPQSSISVGHVGLGLERDARYEAVLTLVVEGRTYTCEAFGPGPRPL